RESNPRDRGRRHRVCRLRRPQHPRARRCHGDEEMDLQHRELLGRRVVVPAIAIDGAVIVGSREGHVYSVDSKTGTQRWVFPANADVLDIVAAPAIAVDGTVFIPSSSTKSLYALDGATGEQKWAFPTMGSFG